jgi:hypothetical protein
MGSSLFEQNLSGSAFRRGLPLPREIRLTGIILSSSLSLFLSRWVVGSRIGRLTATTPFEQAKVANRVERRMVAITVDLKTKDLALGMGDCSARLS